LKNGDCYSSSGVVRVLSQNEKIEDLFAREDSVRERIDDKGEKWAKKYFGGGAHFLNWLEQYREVYGEENVEIEEIDSREFCCFNKGNEKMYRIWVKEKK